MVTASFIKDRAARKSVGRGGDRVGVDPARLRIRVVPTPDPALRPRRSQPHRARTDDQRPVAARRPARRGRAALARPARRRRLRDDRDLRRVRRARRQGVGGRARRRPRRGPARPDAARGADPAGRGHRDRPAVPRRRPRRQRADRHAGVERERVPRGRSGLRGAARGHRGGRRAGHRAVRGRGGALRGGRVRRRRAARRARLSAHAVPVADDEPAAVRGAGAADPRGHARGAGAREREVLRRRAAVARGSRWREGARSRREPPGRALARRRRRRLRARLAVERGAADAQAPRRAPDPAGARRRARRTSR